MRRSDLLAGEQHLPGRLSAAEPRLQTSHRCLWPERVATAPYRSHPACVTAERHRCPPGARSPRQALGSESSIAWPKRPHRLLLRERAQKTWVLRGESSDPPSVSSCITDRLPNKVNPLGLSSYTMFSSARINLFLSLLSKNDYILEHVVVMQTQNQLLHPGWISSISVYFLPTPW